MTLIDRYILGRFFSNFLLLFLLLFLFAATIDIVLALDDFLEAARRTMPEDAGAVRRAGMLVRLIADFEGPRLFQFYQYLHGMLAVGAASFTLARMHRARELVALLSAGVSMQRIAMPFVIGVFLLSLVQLVNQEVMLPRVAPLLLRGHGEIGRREVRDFPVSFSRDGRQSLFQSPSFRADEGVMLSPTIIERDGRGRTLRRISADRARWEAPPAVVGADATGVDVGRWRLEGGEAVSLVALRESGGEVIRASIDVYESDLSPRVLVVRRFRSFAGMLSLRQIAEILRTPGAAGQQGVLAALERHRASRFSAVIVNMLVMWLALPTFLRREPADLLAASIRCAAITIPALTGSALFMTMSLPGIPPAVGTFLPVAILMPVVLAQWTMVRT